MRIILLTIVAAGLLASCTSGPRGRGGDRPAVFAKNPTVILSLDIAQNRLAQEEGVWDALAETAANNSVLFVPEPVVAAEWLKDVKMVAGTRSWAPHRVVMSCDGKSGVTTGEWQRDGRDGYYTNVWQYLERAGKSGEWKWVLHHYDYADSPRIAPEFLQTKVASCKGKPTASVVAPAEGVRMKQSFSRDQSLSWTWQYRPDKSRYLSINIWNGTGWEKVFADKVKAPSAP